MSVVQSPSQQLQSLIKEVAYTQAAMYNTTAPTQRIITAPSGIDLNSEPDIGLCLVEYTIDSAVINSHYHKTPHLWLEFIISSRSEN